jgi:hypothetical protein
MAIKKGEKTMAKRELNSKAWTWWNRLTEDEQDILLGVLYDLDLEEYVDVADDGTYLGRIGE